MGRAEGSGDGDGGGGASDDALAATLASDDAVPGAAALATTIASDDAAVETPASGLAATVAASASSAPVTPAVEVTPMAPGRYLRTEADAEIGRGAIGRVVRYLDVHLGREVAIKELLGDEERVGGSRPSAASRSAAVRFLREARVTGQLEHPAIVPVYELGQRADGTLYYVMREVRGRTLGAALRGARDLAERLRHLDAFLAACQGVAYAHSRGVVHRDLKPDNVMLGEFGETVVLDWGLAKAHGQEDLTGRHIEREVDRISRAELGRTVDGAVMGTPAYMSPEQARGDLEAIDERSDVWSLGAILFELLTGRTPHRGDDVLQVLEAARSQTAPDARSLEAEAPKDLAAIAAKALRPAPDARYPTAAELAREIEDWRDGRQVGAYSYSNVELLRRFVARNRVATAAAAAALVGLLVAAGLIARAGREAAQQRDAARAARGRAEQSAIDAHRALAAAYLEKASFALDEGDPGGAAVYAAAAMLHHPANPRSPYREDGAEADGERPELVLAASYLFAAKGARRYRYRGRLAPPPDRLDDIRGDPVDPSVQGYVAATATPDGRRILAATHGGYVVLYEVPSRSAVRVDRPLEEGGLTHVAVSPDGARYAPLGLDGGSRVRRVADGLVVEASEPLPPGVSAAFDPRGPRIAVGTTSGSVQLLPLAPPEGPAEETVTSEVLFSAGYVNSMIWSPDGRWLALADQTPSVHVWEMAGPPSLLREDTLTNSIYALATDPHGERLLASTVDNRLVEIHLEDGIPPREHRLDTPASSVEWSDDGGFWLEGSLGGEVTVRDAKSRVRVETLHGARRGTHLVVSERDFHWVAAFGREPMGRLWRAEPATSITHLHGFGGAVAHFALGADCAHLVAVEQDLPITIAPLDGAGRFQPRQRRRITHALGADQRPVTVALHPDGERYAFADEGGRVGLGALDDGRLLEWIVEDADGAGWFWWPIAFSPDGDTLYFRDGWSTLARYDLASHATGEPIGETGGQLFAIAVSPDGATVATGTGDGILRLYPSDGGEAQRLEGHGGLVSGLAFSPDGRRLASAGIDRVVRIWDATRRVVVHELQGHQEWVNRVAWSPDGRLLASASDDQTVRVWDADRGALRHVYFTEQQALEVAFSPDGERLYYNDGQRIARADIDLGDAERDPRQLLEEAERFIGMRLSDRALVPMDE